MREAMSSAGDIRQGCGMLAFRQTLADYLTCGECRDRDEARSAESKCALRMEAEKERREDFPRKYQECLTEKSG